LLSDFFHCILLKKLGFKSKPSIAVRMRPLVQAGGEAKYIASIKVEPAAEELGSWAG
jgi:hypothetical protein